MQRFIELAPDERVLYFRQAAAALPYPLPPAVIEKDFWVSWLLHTLLELPATRDRLTFKGGTSLSKAYGIIDRFSEDIDLVLDRSLLLPADEGNDPAEMTNTQRKAYLERLNERCITWMTETLHPALRAHLEEWLPKDQEWSLEPLIKGNEANLLFHYPGSLKETLGSLLPHVLVELVPRAEREPNIPRIIAPLIHQALPDAMGAAHFIAPTLAPERTLLEKALLLHETINGFSKGSERKSRHFYDLMKLDSAGYAAAAMRDRHLFESVVQHRRTYYRYGRMDYDALLRQGISILPTQEAQADWRSDFQRSRSLIYRDEPTFDQLLEAAHAFEEKFNAWVRATVGG